MLLVRSSTIDGLEQTTSALLERIERLEREHAEIKIRFASETAIRLLVAQISGAAQAAPTIGAAIEGFAQAMRAPIPRGRAGGLARARQASKLRERWADGQFMCHDDWERIERELEEEEYMRYAAGGFARAASARRLEDGTFAKAIKRD